ncbi:hypothetical protein KI387_007583, partial [Taxus chinensis]
PHYLPITARALGMVTCTVCIDTRHLRLAVADDDWDHLLRPLPDSEGGYFPQ